MSERPLIDKLGIKPGAKVSVIDVESQAFWGSLLERTKNVTKDKPAEDSDVIIFQTAGVDDLFELSHLKTLIKPNGSIWVVRPKSDPDYKETEVIEAGKAHGLVDNKICIFSDTLSAMRLVIPLADR